MAAGWARCLGRRCAGAASPLGRTRQTAAIICDMAGLSYEAVQFDDRLMEITLGAHDGYHGWAALDRDFPEQAAARKADPWHYRHPGGESSEMVRERLLPVLDELRAATGPHIVIAHGVVNKRPLSWAGRAGMLCWTGRSTAFMCWRMAARNLC